MYKYSIIIIIKNTKKYLSKCLDSVVNQTFRDFEIIIVDDCSDESSQDIVKQYQSVTFHFGTVSGRYWDVQPRAQL